MKNVKRKLRNMDIVAKASMAYVLAGFLQKGISIISGPLFTRILTKSEYGIFSVYNSWFQIIGVLTMLSLSAGVYNNGLLEFKEDRDVFSFSLLVLSNISTLVVGIGVLLFSNIFIKYSRLSPILIFIMFGCYFLMPAMSFWVARQRYEYKYKLSCSVSIISTVIAVGVSLFATYLTNKDKVIVKVGSEKIVLAIVWIILYFYIAIKAKLHIRLKYWRYALSFSLPLIPHYLANYVLNSMDRIMIMYMVDDESAAIYSVAYLAAFMIQIFWQSVNPAILPVTYENIKNGKPSEVEKIVFPYISIYGCLCVIISFVAPEFLLLLAPSSYQNGIYIIPVLLIGAFLTGVYCLFANVEFYYKSTKPIAINSVIAATLNILLNYLGIKIFGYVAAAFTTLICYFIQTLLHFINYKRVSEYSLYSLKKLVVLFAGVVSGCVIAALVYNCILIRYCILLVFFGGIIVYLNKNKDQFNRLRR